MATDVRTLVKTDPEAGRRAMIKLGLGGLLLIILSAIAVFSVFKFIESEREREIRDWQVRLGIVADSRFAAVNEWLEQQLGVLSGLAANQSLQIYMTLLTEGGGEYSEFTEDPAEVGYLRNLLEVTAERTGFTGEAVGADVSANVQRIGVAGIALLDSNFRVVVTTQEMPPVEGGLLEFLEKAARGERLIYDIHIGAGGKPSMGFAVPVFAIQADLGASEQIGTVIGVKEVSEELYPQLIQPGAVEETAETLLVRATETVVEYLSPQLDGKQPLERKLALNTPQLAAAYIIETPGGFNEKKRDYRDREVIVTGRGFTLLPWTLMHKIDRAEALANSEERLNRLLIMFLLFIGVIVAVILAVWWKGSSVRASESAEKFEKLAQRFQNQRDFMHLVTDSQPNSIVIFDEEGHYRWFNQVALAASGLDRKDLFDKTVSAVIGPVEGKKIQKWVKECLEKFERLTFTHAMELEGKGEVIYQSDFTPLEARDEMPAGVLMVSQDVTNSIRERERRERNMRQLVQTLVGVVDRRDPYSADHSHRVGMVAHAICEEMGLDDVLVETGEFAGDLMNLGKILVPEEILAKKDRLTTDEIKLIRESIQTSAELIAGIEFDGPVVESLRQLQENFDGSGSPKGLKGDEILITAQVVSVANAFVAMVSARAFRPAISFDEAADRLFEQSGKIFDRAVVAALINYLDNRGGRSAWADFSKPPKKPMGMVSEDSPETNQERDKGSEPEPETAPAADRETSPGSDPEEGGTPAGG